MSKIIPLTQNCVTVVDNEDYDWLAQYKWCVSSTGYARRRKTIGKGRSKDIYMHRLILGIDDESRTVQGDHINGDRRDNRRSNLRICTPDENKRNMRVAAGATGYRGVYVAKRGAYTYYEARLSTKHLGYFKDAVDAAVTRDAEAIRVHGEYAVLNFPLWQLGRA